jgi:hypothetical protein
MSLTTDDCGKRYCRKKINFSIIRLGTGQKHGFIFGKKKPTLTAVYEKKKCLSGPITEFWFSYKKNLAAQKVF